MSQVIKLEVNKEVILTTVPPGLKPIPPSSHAISMVDLAGQQLIGGMPVILAGVSLSDGSVVLSLGIYQAINLDHPEGADLRGWSLDSESFQLKHQDSTKGDIELSLPALITYFVAEVDESLVLEDANAETLQTIVQFVLPFISDNGPPELVRMAWEESAITE